jgi:hypothetical protein
MKESSKNFLISLVVILLFTLVLQYTSLINVSAADDHYFFNCKNKDYKVYVKSLNGTQVKADCTSIIIKKNGSIVSRNLIDFGDKNDSIETLTNLKKTSIYNKSSTTYKIDNMVLTHAHIDHVKGLKSLYNEMKKNKKIKVHIGTLYLNYVYITNGDASHKHYNLLADLKDLAAMTGKFTVENVCVFTRYNYDISNFNVKDKLSGLAKLVKKANGKASTWSCKNTIKKVNVGGGVFMTILPAITKFDNGQPEDDVNNSTLMVVIKDKTMGTNGTGNFKIDIMSDIKVATNKGAIEGIEKLLEQDKSGNYKYSQYISELSKNKFEELILKMPHHGVFGYTSYQKGMLKKMFKVMEPTWVIGTAWTVKDRQKSYQDCRSFINSLNNEIDEKYEGPFIDIEKTFNNIAFIY